MISLSAGGVTTAWSMTRTNLVRPWWTGWSRQAAVSCLTSAPRAFLQRLSGTHSTGASLTMRAECQGLLATGPLGLSPSLTTMIQARTNAQCGHCCKHQVLILIGSSAAMGTWSCGVQFPAFIAAYGCMPAVQHYQCLEFDLYKTVSYQGCAEFDLSYQHCTDQVKVDIRSGRILQTGPAAIANLASTSIPSWMYRSIQGLKPWHLL